MGLVIGVLVQYFDVQPFIASLAGLFLARGLAYVVSLKSIRVEHSGVLWLESTRFSIGDWYITLHGYAAYSGVTLLGSLTTPVALARMSVSAEPNFYKAKE